MSKGRFDDLEDKAYYSSEREIKSRVVLEYDLPQIKSSSDGTKAIKITSISPAQSSFSNLDEVVDQSIVKSRNFGSFEKNQFKLDGNFYLPYRDKPSSWNWGSNYVSEDIPSYQNKPLKLTLEIKNKLILDPVNAFTIVFDDNYPKNIDLSIKNNDKLISSYTISENSNSYIYIELKEPIDFTKLGTEKSYLYISASNWNLDNEETIYRRRIRLKKILFGLVEEYSDTEILSMNIINQKKKFCEEIPENECEFTIGNYSGEFDLLNEKGKKRHLSKRTTIIPWIGINTDDGTKYENRGIFFLDNWKNNEDETVTFTGKDIFSVVKNAVLVENGQSGLFDETIKGYYMNYIFSFPTLNAPQYSRQMMNYITRFLAGVFTYVLKKEIQFAWDRDNLQNNQYCGSWTISTEQTKSKNVVEFLQKLAVASGCVLDTNMYVDEGLPDYLQVTLNPLESYNNETVLTDKQICYDIITLDDMTSEPVVTKIDKINKVKVTQTNVFQGDNELPSDYTETKITQVLNQDYEIIPIFFDSPTIVINKEDLKKDFNIASSSTIWYSDTQSMSYWQENYYMIFLQTKLKKGETYTQTLKVAQVSKPEISAEYTNKEDSKIPDVVLEINNEIIPWLHTGFGRANCKKMAQYYLDNATQYKVSFEFFGNARVKPGDTIKVETRYGYIYVWVEKTEFNYDGGLICKVEGVSTGGLINE